MLKGQQIWKVKGIQAKDMNVYLDVAERAAFTAMNDIHTSTTSAYSKKLFGGN